MERTSLSHVKGNKVVKAVERAWELVLGRLRWSLHQAEYSSNILLALRDRQVTPGRGNQLYQQNSFKTHAHRNTQDFAGLPFLSHSSILESAAI